MNLPRFIELGREGDERGSIGGKKKEKHPPSRAGSGAAGRDAVLGQKAVVVPWPGALLMPLQRIRGFFPLAIGGGKVVERKKGISRRLAPPRAGAASPPAGPSNLIPKSWIKIKSEGGQAKLE